MKNQSFVSLLLLFTKYATFGCPVGNAFATAQERQRLAETLTALIDYQTCGGSE